SANGYAPRTSSCRSSTAISSSAAIATICCASTSSGLRGITVSSIAPACIRSATTADSNRSARNFGKIRPFDVAWSSCPARPMRESLREAAVVDEDDRGAMLLDEAQDLGIDRRPDRLLRSFAPGSEQVGRLRVAAGLSHVLERDDDAQVELLRDAGVDQLNRS